MNTEATRLRKLRQSALRVRALAAALNVSETLSTLVQRGALLSWRIARLATCKLRSHPSYLGDPSFFESGADRLSAILLGTAASLSGQGAEIFLRELRVVASELCGTGTLTLSAEFRDSLNGAELSLNSLIQELERDALLRPQCLTIPT